MTKNRQDIKVYEKELLELSKLCKVAQDVGIDFQYSKPGIVNDVFAHSSNSDMSACTQQHTIVDLIGELNEIVDYTRRVLVPTLLEQREMIRKQAIRLSDLVWRVSRLKSIARSYRERLACSTWRPIHMLDPKEGDYVLLRSRNDVVLAYFDGYDAFTYYDPDSNAEKELWTKDVKEFCDAFMMVPKFEPRLLRRWK